MPSYEIHSDEDWASRRDFIRRLIQEEHKSQDYVKHELQKQGFSVSKDQLRYKLEQWSIRRRLRKNMSRSAWEYIHQTISAGGLKGQALHVIVDGRRLAEDEIQNGIRRNLPIIPLYRSHDRPKTPKGMMIAITSPPPIELSFNWPPELPWLQFTARHPQLLSNSPQKTNGAAFGLSNIERIIIPCGLSRCTPTLTEMFLPIFELGTIMPESFKDENIRRAQLIISGSTRDKAEELVKILLFQISNNFIPSATHGENLYPASNLPESAQRWWDIFQVLKQSGITKTPLEVSASSDPALFAVAEKLFKEVLTLTQFPSVKLNPLIVTVLDWLLSSGVSPDTRIPCTEICEPLRVPFFSPLEACLRFCEQDKDEMQIAVEALLRAGATVDDTWGPRPLCLAAKLRPGQKKLQLIRTFLSYGARINFSDKKPSRIPLMAASSSGDLAAVDLLLRNGGDAAVSCKSQTLSSGELGRPIWEPEPYYGSEEINVLSCAAGVNPEPTALELVQYLMKTQHLTPSNASIVSASWFGNNEVLRLLLSQKGDVNAMDTRGFSAIGAAAFRGHVATCKLLIQLGATLSFRETHKLTPFYLAVLGNQKETAELFYSLGVYDNQEADLERIRNFITVGLAFDRDHCPEVEMALKRCQSPIGAAIMHWKPDEPEPLYDLLYRWGLGLPPWTLQFGSRTNNVDLVALALSAGCDPHSTGQTGQTALEAAITSLDMGTAGVAGLSIHPKTGPTLIEQRNETGTDRTGQIAYMLIEAGATPVREIISLAIQTEHRPLLHAVTQQGKMGLSAMELELAIIHDSKLVEDIWDCIPDVYSAGALCAATVKAVTEDCLSWVHRLLKNRPSLTNPKNQDLEILAICIASTFQDVEVLKSLLEAIPVSQCAPHHFVAGFGRDIREHSSRELYPTQIGITGRPRWYDRCNLIASPLAYAVDSPTVLDMLLQAGYLPDWTTLSEAVYSGDRDVMKKLLDHEISPEPPMVWSLYLNQTFRKPLTAAVYSKDTETLSLILSRGFSINDNSNEINCGRSALQLAVEEANLAAIGTLLSAGSCVNTPAASHSGATALQLACIKGWLGISKKLIELGADINAPRAAINGRTALEGAAEHGRLDMVQLLLSSGALTTGNGRRQYLTATYLAERNGHRVITNLLRSWGPWDQDLEDKYIHLHRQWAANCDLCDSERPINRVLEHYLDNHSTFSADDDLPGTLKMEKWPDYHVPSFAMRQESNIDNLACGYCDPCSKRPGLQTMREQPSVDWTLGEELGDDSFWNGVDRLEVNSRTDQEPTAGLLTGVDEVE